MVDSLEKNLAIDINMTDYRKMLEIFDLAKSIQLPVVDKGKIAGLLSIFDVCSNISGTINVSDIMERDFEVAGVEEGAFSFANSKQYILPYVDEDGYLHGFINRIILKCYLPNEEYLNAINKGLDELFDQINDTDMENSNQLDNLRKSFDVILENNYDGIYVTLDKGDTMSINENAMYIHNVEFSEAESDGEKVYASFKAGSDAFSRAGILQHVQKRKEFSLSESVISDGGIIRAVDNLEAFEKMRSKLEQAEILADSYKSQLEIYKIIASNDGELIAESDKMKSVLELALKISKVETTALIQGPSGAGKGVISRFIHENSNRRNGPFVKIDCGAIPEHLLESELFGYVKGAFTGAEKDGKIGQIEMAEHGTVLLDEIGELPMSLQTKLLRLIQDRQIMRVGSNELIDVDIRILAATNRDLKAMVQEGTFREDLFYRLNVVPLFIPPLNNRFADIKPLVEKAMNRFNEKYGTDKTIDKRALRALMDYSWPGNVRELENVVEYLMVTAEGNRIKMSDLPENIAEKDSGETFSLDNVTSMKDAVATLEVRLLKEAMAATKSTEEMAMLLKMDRSTVTRKLQKYGIKPDFRNR